MYVCLCADWGLLTVFLPITAVSSPSRLFICIPLYVCPSEDDQKEKSLSHHTIQQLIMEKDQALADLNSVEKSLADLFRRYEKMKDVLEGFRKVTQFIPRFLSI